MKRGDVEVIVVKGDITEVESEAIVNAANNQFFMGGGVAGAIKRVGGRVIEKEARSKGPVNVGEAIITSAGNLKAIAPRGALPTTPNLSKRELLLTRTTKPSI